MLTPRMKQIFAKRFVNYFDNYAQTHLADLTEENLADLITAHYSV